MARSQVRLSKEYEDHRLGMTLMNFRHLRRRVTIALADLP